MDDSAHAKAGKLFGDDTADCPKAYDAEWATMQLDARECELRRTRAATPYRTAKKVLSGVEVGRAGPNPCTGRDEVASEPQRKSNRELCNPVIRSPESVHYSDPPRRGGRHIDVRLRGRAY